MSEMGNKILKTNLAMVESISRFEMYQERQQTGRGMSLSGRITGKSRWRFFWTGERQGRKKPYFLLVFLGNYQFFRMGAAIRLRWCCILPRNGWI